MISQRLEQQQTIRIDLKLPMLKYMELVASQVSEAVAELMLFDEERSLEVSMALLEACINSFEHSNSEDRNIYITFEAEDDILKIILRDSGVGFNPDTVSMRNLEEHKNTGIRKRGWGLKLMESLMDTVDIQSDHTGTTVTMIKKR